MKRNKWLLLVAMSCWSVSSVVENEQSGPSLDERTVPRALNNGVVKIIDGKSCGRKAILGGGDEAITNLWWTTSDDGFSIADFLQYHAANCFILRLFGDDLTRLGLATKHYMSGCLSNLPTLVDYAKFFVRNRKVYHFVGDSDASRYSLVGFLSYNSSAYHTSDTFDIKIVGEQVDFGTLVELMTIMGVRHFPNSDDAHATIAFAKDVERLLSSNQQEIDRRRYKKPEFSGRNNELEVLRAEDIAADMVVLRRVLKQYAGWLPQYQGNVEELLRKKDEAHAKLMEAAEAKWAQERKQLEDQIIAERTQREEKVSQLIIERTQRDEQINQLIEQHNQDRLEWKRAMERMEKKFDEREVEWMRREAQWEIEKMEMQERHSIEIAALKELLRRKDEEIRQLRVSNYYTGAATIAATDVAETSATSQGSRPVSPIEMASRGGIRENVPGSVVGNDVGTWTSRFIGQTQEKVMATGSKMLLPWADGSMPSSTTSGGMGGSFEVLAVHALGALPDLEHNSTRDVNPIAQPADPTQPSVQTKGPNRPGSGSIKSLDNSNKSPDNSNDSFVMV